MPREVLATPEIETLLVLIGAKVPRRLLRQQIWYFVLRLCHDRTPQRSCGTPPRHTSHYRVDTLPSPVLSLGLRVRVLRVGCRGRPGCPNTSTARVSASSSTGMRLPKRSVRFLLPILWSAMSSDSTDCRLHVTTRPQDPIPRATRAPYPRLSTIRYEASLVIATPRHKCKLRRSSPLKVRSWVIPFHSRVATTHPPDNIIVCQPTWSEIFSRPQ